MSIIVTEPLIIKKGVVVDGLKAPMAKAWDAYSELYRIAGYAPVMTDGVAKRDTRSLHPLGYAIDVRLRGIQRKSVRNLFVMKLKEELKTDYDVILFKQHESYYLHIEYQRYLDDQKNMCFSDVLVSLD